MNNLAPPPLRTDIVESNNKRTPDAVQRPWQSWFSDIFRSLSELVSNHTATGEELAHHIGQTTSAHGGIVSSIDPRLADKRAPLPHTQDWSTITNAPPIPPVVTDHDVLLNRYLPAISIHNSRHSAEAIWFERVSGLPGGSVQDAVSLVQDGLTSHAALTTTAHNWKAVADVTYAPISLVSEVAELRAMVLYMYSYLESKDPTISGILVLNVLTVAPEVATGLTKVYFLG